MQHRRTADTENETDDKVEENHEKVDLKGDYGNIALLLLLYLLQGSTVIYFTWKEALLVYCIPLGISGAIPILLQNRGISYVQQAGFTFAFYPFTMKILWAPVVDSLYIKSFGRRKSWLVPVQFFIGLFMIFMALNVDDWMGDGADKGPQMIWLTAGFFVLYFFAATQDIAVDGWALTMLKRENVGYAATCNAVGQTAGGFLGYVVFLVLESKEFSNKYVFSEPRDEGLVTLPGFLRFWGIIYLVVTVLIAIFKRERCEAENELKTNPNYGITKAYPILWKILKLKPIIRFSLILLTAKFSFAACDAITTLKLVEYGIPKDKVALLAIPLVPLNILLPFIISRFTSGPHSMRFFLNVYPYRLIITIVIAAFTYATPAMITNDGKTIVIPIYFYVTIVSIYIVYQVPLKAMYVTHMAFMSRISDPLVGGTYMTLLNTISNLGGMWLKTFCLWLVDFITWKSCVFDDANSGNATTSLTGNTCANKLEKSECLSNGGTCRIDIDGYYIEVALNVVYGVIWCLWAKGVIKYLEEVPPNEWHVLSKHDEDATPLNDIVAAVKK